LGSEGRNGPFTGYESKQYPDPRTSPPTNIREAVRDIIVNDGPLTKESIYRLYRDGCPRVERASKHLRQAVNRALFHLERSGLVAVRDEGTQRDPSEVVVRLESQEWVYRRPAGARDFEEIPLSELAEVLSQSNGGLQPITESAKLDLYREVAKHYGVRRFTPPAAERIQKAARMILSGGATANAPVD
jgi:hypothetical protein